MHGAARIGAAGVAAGGVPAPYAPGQESSGRLPLRGWPGRSDMAYVREAITTLLLVLALPWLVVNLVRRPGFVFAGAAGQHVKEPPG